MSKIKNHLFLKSLFLVNQFLKKNQK